MDGVLKGFFVVGMVLLVGYILARTNALGPHGTKVLSTLTFMVGLPSLMFSTIASRHISEVLSQTGLISVVTALCVMALFALSGAIGRWGVRRTTIGALATGIVNSTNLGVPLSLYILGSATFVTPIMLFQLALVTPVALTILDLTDPEGKRASVWSILSTPLRNPVTVAAVLGVIVSAAGIELPALVLDPLKLVAQLTVPLMLIIFGMSLHGLSPRQSTADRVPTLFAVILKSAVQPALAWLLAVFVFRLDTFSTFVVTACAILPTGQNVVLYAVRYGVGQNLAQSTAVITSALAVPLLLGAAWMFG
ncbi:putative AEC family transporter [Arthrobacter globiformis NBRC 12137]|uniref:Putative AEC family transporter n=1 Tax=Arthrobacter globiformis (strain ATCC 8010 / DSM 20124 / JCM 1332 / NBRC 12137 / NCIMB 8907 / NRRL B-2979 / 168) TaxID=1077972 RepID=H0QKC7_ARTG1|nr:AEC family transporter [Arthrobacter globiformis]GAB13367.1 putative AEC family transporter [Arthrobacter globiformis NBRC 12137]